MTERVSSYFLKRYTAPSPVRPAPSVNKRHQQQFVVFLVSTGVSFLFLSAAAYYWTSVGPHKSFVAAANIKSVERVTAMLSIPKINLHAAIVGWQLPSPGMKVGNTADATKLFPGTPVIEHHDSVFKRLPELQVGDEIVVTQKSKEYHYSVQSKAVVGPKDIPAPQTAKEHLMLVTTCPPNDGPAAPKLVIVATLQKSSELATNPNRE